MPRSRILLALACLTLCALTPLAAAQHAMRFDGGDDHLVIPHAELLSVANGDPLTVEFWMKAVSGGWHVFGKRGTCYDAGQSSNYQFWITVGSGTQLNSGACLTEGAGPPAGEWVHMAIVADGTGSRIYTNGELTGQSACPISGANTSPLWIGGTTDCGYRYYGDLEEFRIWNVARSQAQIQANMLPPIAPNTPGLVAVWRFDEAVDEQKVRDSGANALHGWRGETSEADAADPLRVSSDWPGAEYLFRDGFE